MINNTDIPINTGKTTTITLPVTVRNIKEARIQCKDYKSVLTAGPEHYEVSDFGHDDHKIVSFDDTISVLQGGPTIKDVQEMIEWGCERDNILVHCHAGMSRSTATAWGICIGHGLDPRQSIETLSANHPVETVNNGFEFVTDKRAFIPNDLIVMHIEKLFGYKQGFLLDMREEFEHWTF